MKEQAEEEGLDIVFREAGFDGVIPVARCVWQ